MSAIPAHIRSRIAQLGRLSGPLDETRARQLAAALAETVASQIKDHRDPSSAIEIYETRIATEARLMAEPTRSQPRRARPALKDVLQTFAVDDHYAMRQTARSW